jgi:hypothetical protein
MDILCEIPNNNDNHNNYNHNNYNHNNHIHNNYNHNTYNDDDLRSLCGVDHGRKQLLCRAERRGRRGLEARGGHQPGGLSVLQEVLGLQRPKL